MNVLDGVLRMSDDIGSSLAAADRTGDVDGARIGIV